MRKVIYSISDPLNMKVIYVGQTNNLEIRVATHMTSCHNDLLGLRINEILNSGKEPIFKILEVCKLPLANISEKKWINAFEKTGSVLLNKKVGRPKIEKDINKKQMAVYLHSNILYNDIFKEKTKKTTFAKYVNSLIAQDLGL